ncbi:MAG: FecR family protein [Spirochaetota bacterium]
MEEQRRRRRGLWIALVLVGALVAALVTLVVLAMPSSAQLDRLSQRPQPSDAPLDVSGVVVITTEQIEALADRQIAAAFGADGGAEYLGLAVTAEPDALTVMSGARARVLGSMRTPLVLRARAVVTTRGDGRALIRLDRVWIGRLPLPRALVARLLPTAVDRADVEDALDPLGVSYDADAPGLRWDLPFTAADAPSTATLPLPPGVSITSVGVSPTGVRLGLALPAGLEEALRASALALLGDRDELVERARSVLGGDYETEIASFDASLEHLARTISEPTLRSGGVVSYAEGTSVAHVPGEEPRPIALGDRLPVGTTVETGRDGCAELALPGGHRLLVRPRSTVTLDEATLAGPDGAGRVHVTATVGKLRAVVSELARDDGFAVDTPNGTLGVRGTDFVVQVDRSATQLTVLDGGVAVAPDTASLAAATVYAAGRVARQSDPPRAEAHGSRVRSVSALRFRAPASPGRGRSRG